jgi:hypothetical protein
MKTKRAWFAGGVPVWLRGVVCGLCLVGLAEARSSAPPDVSYVFLVKSRSYTQNSADLVRLTTDDNQGPFRFDVEVDPSSPGSVLSASVTKPDSSLVSLVQDSWDDSFRVETQSKVMPDVDAAAQRGSYVIHATGAVYGEQDVTLSLGADDFPGIPQIINFAAAQAVDVTADFSLMWSVFDGGTTSDAIIVEVDDADTGNAVWSTPMPNQTGTLDGTAEMVAIPANTLQSGRNYNVSLTFARPTEMKPASTYLAYGAFAVFLSQTTMPLRTAGADTTAPVLGTVVPQSGQSGVARNSAILFRFNETMNTSLPTTSIVWSGTGVDTNNFSYQWTGDGKALVAKYNGLLPASTTVTWSFVTGTSGNYPKDLAGNKVAVQSGSFTTGSDPSSMPLDATMAIVGKMQESFQDGAGVRSMGARLFVTGDATGMNTIFAGSVQKTSSPLGPLAGFKASKSEGSLDFEAPYVSKDDLDTWFEDGTYTMVLKGAHNGSKTAFALSLDTENYPNVPTCNNFAALQSADPAAAVMIGWDAFSGAGANDVVSLEITDIHDNWVFDSQLPASQTSVSVPSGTFSPGRQYNVTLIFGKMVTIDTKSYAGASVMSAWARQTLFRIHTAGSPIKPVVTGQKIPGGSFNMNFHGERNWRYLVEASSDLVHWLQIRDAWTDGTGGAFVSDGDAGFLPKRFYRLSELDPNAGFSQMIAIQGHVLTQGTSAPIAGAVVGTSLDGATAVTDSGGSFFLITQTPSTGNGTLVYTITVTKSGYQTYSSSGSWGDEPRGQTILLNP